MMPRLDTAPPETGRSRSTFDVANLNLPQTDSEVLAIGHFEQRHPQHGGILTAQGRPPAPDLYWGPVVQRWTVGARLHDRIFTEACFAQSWYAA